MVTHQTVAAHTTTGTRSRTRLALAGAAAALVLAACASPADIPPGSSLSEVQARLGAPTVECPLPNGARRVVWSSAPMGQVAWAAEVTPDGHVGQVTQVLTDRSFDQVKSGEWNAEGLVCVFGPPAERSQVGFGDSRQTVWSYRYRQASAWDSLMHIYFGPDGRVTHLHPGPDPLFDPDEWKIH